jgi:hypothetical protein
MNARRGVVLSAICLLVFSVMALTACGGSGSKSDDTGGNGNEPTVAADDGGGTEEEQPPEGDGTTDEGTDGGGGSDGSDGGEEVSDACSLLTVADVEDAFGTEMLDAELIELPDMQLSSGGTASVSSCSFLAAVGVDSLSVTVTSASPGDDAGIGAMIELACQNKDEIAGLGDQACWFSEAHTEIQMKAGATFVDIFVTTVEGDSTAITSALAETIAGHLQ